MKVSYSVRGVISSPADLEWIGNKGEELLHDAGVTKYWDDHELGRRVFEVERMPKDAPVFGIFWVEV